MATSHNATFTTRFPNTRVNDFPDESGTTETVPFPECRESLQREFLHLQLMRIIRTAEGEKRSYGRIAEIIQSYEMNLHDLNIREIDRKVNKLKKEQLYSRHMMDWLKKEIAEPTRVTRQSERSKRLQKRVEKAIQEANDADQEMRVTAARIETENLVTSGVLAVPVAGAVGGELKADGSGFLDLPPGVAGIASVLGNSSASAIPPLNISTSVEIPGGIGQQPPPTAGGWSNIDGKATAGNNAFGGRGSGGFGGGNSGAFGGGGNAGGRKKSSASEDKGEKKKKVGFVERNYKPNCDRLFTRYLNAKKAFERDFSEGKITVEETNRATPRSGNELARKKLLERFAQPVKNPRVESRIL